MLENVFESAFHSTSIIHCELGKTIHVQVHVGV